ncbi:MAG: hypothetical protein JKY50_00030 [Oleispira sp.]|nr:hypothetical protein [Oleispira sp.]
MPDKYKPIKNKIIGWTITEYCELGVLGTVKKTHCEYGNSPIRDKRSRIEYLNELNAKGVDYSLVPIFKVDL